MNIFDCTTFFNERLMMDLRFNILNDHVSKFVVVESTFSHSGEKKKLNFNIDDYPKFKDKIIYIPIDKEPYGLVKGEELIKNPFHKRLNSIKRIEQSYNYMSNGISEALDNDLIMISDNDEIPNLDSIEFKKSRNNFFLFKQKFLFYKFDLLYDKFLWYGTKACKKKKLKNFSSLRNLKNKKYPFWRFDTLFSKTKQIDVKVIDEGGWHFTNLKTPEELYIKLKNFGHHDEFDLADIKVEDLRMKIEQGIVFYDHFADKSSKDKWNYNYKLKIMEHKFLPSYLIRNKDKYNMWFQKIND